MKMLLDAIRPIGCSALFLWGAALLVSPASAAVESDVVGYTTITTSADFTMLGVVFKGFDGEALPLNEIVSGAFVDGDQIQIYDRDSGYKLYRYYNNDWVGGDFLPATTPIEPGTAFWLKTSERAVEVTLKGAVPTGNYSYVSKSGFQMVSPNSPIAFNLNEDIEWGEGLVNSDQIQVRSGNSYQIYRYYNGAWVGGDFMPVTTKIPVGSSIWLNTQNAGVMMTFKSSI